MGRGLGSVVAVAAAGLVAVGLAACGSGNGSSSASTPAPTPTSASTTTTTVTTTTSSATGSQPHAVGGVGGCAPAQTAVSAGQGTAGLGHGGTVLLFRNSGTQTCRLTGYPGVALVPAQAGGHELEVARTPDGYLGGLATSAKSNPVVVLRPGQVGSALLEGLDSSQPSGGPCPKYASVLVTPPNQTVTARLKLSLSICNPEIHPVVPGTTGRQS